MPCNIIFGFQAGTDLLENAACFYDTVTMTAFGPVFKDKVEAGRFWDWLADDPRRFSADNLETLYAIFRVRRARLSPDL